MSPRAYHTVVGAAGIVFGLLLVALGLVRQHVRCDRADGECTIRQWPLAPARIVRLDEIREHRFWLRRAGVQLGETVLTDLSGRRIVIAGGPVGAARARYEAFQAFYAGQTDEVELRADVGWTEVVGGLVGVLVVGVWWRDKRRLAHA